MDRAPLLLPLVAMTLAGGAAGCGDADEPTTLEIPFTRGGKGGANPLRDLQTSLGGIYDCD